MSPLFRILGDAIIDLFFRIYLKCIGFVPACPKCVISFFIGKETMMLQREYDIQSPAQGDISLTIDGQSVSAMTGETVLSVLNAVGQRAIARNDHLQVMGAYCGMGI